MDEEIEIKQLRKEQVPRAHPMPDFTRPFAPKRYGISNHLSPVFSSDLIIIFCIVKRQSFNLTISAPRGSKSTEIIDSCTFPYTYAIIPFDLFSTETFGENAGH